MNIQQETRDLIDRVNNASPYIKDIIVLCNLYKKDDKWAKAQLEKLITLIDSDRITYYEYARTLVLCGYEPAFKYISLYRSNTESAWGDYWNEYFKIDFSNKAEFDFCVDLLKQRPILLYEERYWGTFYDISSKKLNVKDDDRVVRINKITKEINSTVESISMEHFRELIEKVRYIIYG